MLSKVSIKTDISWNSIFGCFFKKKNQYDLFPREIYIYYIEEKSRVHKKSYLSIKNLTSSVSPNLALVLANVCPLYVYYFPPSVSAKSEKCFLVPRAPSLPTAENNPGVWGTAQNIFTDPIQNMGQSRWSAFGGKGLTLEGGASAFRGRSSWRDDCMERVCPEGACMEGGLSGGGDCMEGGLYGGGDCPEWVCMEGGLPGGVTVWMGYAWRRVCRKGVCMEGDLYGRESAGRGVYIERGLPCNFVM